MTNRARNVTVRIETDIEKSREESNWQKVIELAEQLKEKTPNYGYYFFIIINLSKNTSLVITLLRQIFENSCRYFIVYIRLRVT